jgi:hypothetical protein
VDHYGDSEQPAITGTEGQWSEVSMEPSEENISKNSSTELNLAD